MEIRLVLDNIFAPKNLANFPQIDDNQIFATMTRWRSAALVTP